MKQPYVTTDRIREGFQAGYDLLNPHVSRPNCAPAYYQGRPAALWINAMKPRRGRSRGPWARQPAA
jgi:hypothetical protein